MYVDRGQYQAIRVEQLALSTHHLKQRKIARETGIWNRTVGLILKNDLCLHYFQKNRATELTEVDKQ